MSKVSIVLYYWVFIVLVLLLARVLGYSDNNKAILVIIAVATAVYIGANMVIASSRSGKRKK